MSSRWRRQTLKCLTLWWWTHRNARTCLVSSECVAFQSAMFHYVHENDNNLKFDPPVLFRPVQFSSWPLPSRPLRSQTGGEIQIPSHPPASSAPGHPKQGHWDICKSQVRLLCNYSIKTKSGNNLIDKSWFNFLYSSRRFYYCPIFVYFVICICILKERIVPIMLLSINCKK